MKTIKALPPIERLRELFTYDPTTGLLEWRKRRFTRKNTPGRGAGFFMPKGYLGVCVDGSTYQHHRVIWAMVTGEDPAGKLIDHINQVKADNRWVNLRLSSNSQNMANNQGYERKDELPKNVYQHGNRYQVCIRADGKLHYFGSYRDPQEAEAVAVANHKRLFGAWSNAA